MKNVVKILTFVLIVIDLGMLLAQPSPIGKNIECQLSDFEIALNTDLDQAQEYAHALTQKHDLPTKFLGYYNLARVYTTTNEIQKEGVCIDSLDLIVQELSDSLFIGLNLLAKAGLAQKLERNGQAIYLLGRSIELLENTPYYRFRVMALRNLGNILLELENIADAEQYYLQAIDIARENNDSHLLAHFYSEISSFYHEIKQTSKADYYLNKSDSLNQFVGAKLLESINLGKHGDNYFDKGLFEQALLTYKESLKIAKDLRHSNFIALFNFKIGQVYSQLQNAKKAIYFLEESLKYSEQVGNKDLQKANYQFLTDIYRRLDNKQAVIDYLSQLRETEEEINDERQLLAAQRLAYKFESHKKQEEITVLKAQNRLKSIEQKQLIYEKKQQKNQLYLLFVLLLLSIALFVVITHNLRQKSKKEQILAQKNKELHLQKIQEIENLTQLKILNAILEGQEKERERIARDLHDSLGGTLSALQLQFQNMTSDEDHQNIEDLLGKACTEVREISHNMMPVSLKKLGLHHAIQDYVNHINASKQMVVDFYSFGEMKPFSPTTRLNIFRLIQEGVNNAVKHANAAAILIQLIYKKNQLSILIEDDGKGFDFSKTKNSFGLKNMQNRIAFLGSTLTIDSAIGRGTTLMFEVNV